MKRTALFLTSLLYCALSTANISNLIVFGESLSDGGNFPESANIWWNPSSEKTMSNAVAQFYVPFSDPVDTSTLTTARPTLDDRYLSKQAGITGQTSPRKYRSISWPQFFLAMTTATHITKSDIISPSHLLSTRQIPADYSFNYAWGYSTSGKGCVNPYYAHYAACDAKTISTARENYVTHPTMDNYEQLQIPGLGEQVKLFIQDHHDHKVVIDKNTVYVFWTGGNDLIIASSDMLKKHVPWPAIQFLSGLTAVHVTHTIKRLLNALPKADQPKQIYVFNMFNPEFTPGYFGTKIAPVGNFAVKVYNFWLSVHVALFNVFSTTKIVIVPLYDWYQKSSADPIYKNQMGKTCQLSNGDYTSATKIPGNNCAGYLFWNAVHPATPMQIRVAQQFLTTQFH